MRIISQSISEWVTKLKIDPSIYARVPNEIKDNSSIVAARFVGWANSIDYKYDLVEKLPEEIRNSPILIDVFETRYLELLRDDIKFYDYIPDEFKKFPSIRNVAIAGFLSLLKGKYFDGNIPSELLDSPDIQEARFKYFCDAVYRYPTHQWVPKDLRDNPLILEMQIQGVIREIFNSGVYYIFDYFNSLSDSLKNNIDIYNALIEQTIRSLKNDPRCYSEIPEEFKENKEFLDARLVGWKLLLPSTNIVTYERSFTQDLLDNPEINSLRIKSWAMFIGKDLLYTRSIPDDIIDSPIIKESILNRICIIVERSPDSYKDLQSQYSYIDETMFTNQLVMNALLKGWCKIVEQYPDRYPLVPEDMRYTKEIQAAREEGFCRELIAKPKLYSELPKEFRDRPRILKHRYEGWRALLAYRPHEIGNLPSDLIGDKNMELASIYGYADLLIFDKDFNPSRMSEEQIIKAKECISKNIYFLSHALGKFSQEYIKEILLEYNEDFDFPIHSVDRFYNVNLCKELSKYTNRDHYDKKKFLGYCFSKLEDYKKDHIIETKLKSFNKIFMNQVSFFSEESMFNNWLNEFVGCSETLNDALSSDYYKEIENWLVEMSTKGNMINSNENLFKLSCYIPKLINKEKKEFYEIEMGNIIDKYPTPSRDRMEARKKLENYLNNSFKVTIKKDNLHYISVLEDNKLYEKLLLDKDSISEDQQDFFIESMRDLIVYNNNIYEKKYEFVKQILEGDSSSNIKSEEINISIGKYSYLFKILEKRDPLGLIIGEQPYSGCCFKIGGASEDSLLESYINPDTGILVLYDGRGKFLAQSWIWLTRDKKAIVLDNIEFATRFSNDESETFLYKIFEDFNIKSDIDKLSLIREAYKEFGRIYKEKTGLSVLVGSGYDDLGLREMGLELFSNWKFSDNYPKMVDKELPYTDARQTFRLANWYRYYLKNSLSI